MTREEMLAFYAAPEIFSGVDGFENEVAAVSSDVVSIVEFVQGLLIHEALGAVYGITLPPERTAEKQIHAANLMLTQAKRLDAGALGQARPPAKRVIGVCRHFATLFVALMRSKGIPCRARCGFANYFIPGKHVDHWVAEYWNADQGRWILVDVQVDEPQRQLYRVDFDTLDVPRDRFLVGGDAWRACRNGADPMNFGIAGTPIWDWLKCTAMSSRTSPPCKKSSCFLGVGMAWQRIKVGWRKRPSSTALPTYRARQTLPRSTCCARQSRAMPASRFLLK